MIEFILPVRRHNHVFEPPHVREVDAIEFFEQLQLGRGEARFQTRTDVGDSFEPVLDGTCRRALGLIDDRRFRGDG